MEEYTYEVISIGSLEMIKRTDENGQESWIPKDPANSDYQEYLKSLEEGDVCNA